MGGCFFLNCNYDIKDYKIPSQFYCELLLWWSNFRDTFASENEWQNIIWNNKEIRIDNKLVFYQNYLESGVIYVRDLQFDLNTKDAYSHFSHRIYKTNFLQLAGLQHSIPLFLKNSNLCPPVISPLFSVGDSVFEVKKKKSKDYCSLLVRKKAQFPNMANKLQSDFSLSTDQVSQFFILPHSVALESYVKAFQYKVLNSILYTNTKLCKIGFKTDDLCSFCEAQPETLHHLLFHCVFARHFWNEFQIYWHQLSNQHIQLTLQDVFLGIISYPCPLLSLLNYFIIIGKLFL